MAKTPAQTACDLLVWARQHRIAIAEVTVGDVRLSGITDMALAAANIRAPTKEDADSLYRQYGGNLIDKVRQEIESEDDTFEDDDEGDEGPSEPHGTRRGQRGRGRAPRR